MQELHVDSCLLDGQFKHDDFSLKFEERAAVCGLYANAICGRFAELWSECNFSFKFDHLVHENDSIKSKLA